MAWIYIVFTSFICVVMAQTDDDAAKIPEIVSPDIQKYYNESGLADAKDKYMEMFQKKCKKNGHPEAYDSLQTNMGHFVSCVGSLIDMETVLQEIEEAKPTGRVDEVFKKYCHKTPLFTKCFRNLTESVKPCFSVKEQKHYKTLYNVTDQLMEFICYKDGDRIALFIAEGGKECFQEKQDDVVNCFNEELDLNQTQKELQNITDIDQFFYLEFKEKQCDQMTAIQKCVVSVLETCIKPTTANIVESLFNFIRKSTPCKEFKQVDNKRTTPGGAASGLALTSSTVFMALITAMLI